MRGSQAEQQFESAVREGVIIRGTPGTRDGGLDTEARRQSYLKLVKGQGRVAAPALNLLPVKVEELTERSVHYAAQAILRAQNAGILRKERGRPRIRVDISKLQYKAVLIRGQDHYINHTECQDAIAIHHDTQCFVAVTCDGAGGLPGTHVGARLLANEALTVAKELLADPTQAYFVNGSFLNEGFLGELHKRMYVATHRFANETGMEAGEAYRSFLSATVQILLMTPFETAIVALGDGFVTWNGERFSIEDRVGRPEQLREANHPPLLSCGVAFDAGSEPMREGDAVIKEALQEEARSFYVVAYGPTAEIILDGAELATDGVRFTRELLRSRDGTIDFPLHKLLDMHAADEVIRAGNLFNLAADSAGKDSKIDLLLVALNEKNGTNYCFPEIRDAVTNAIAAEFREQFPDDPDLERLLGEFDPVAAITSGLVADDYCRFALTTLAKVSEIAGVQAARRVLVKEFDLDTFGGAVPLWDDIGLVRVFIEEQDYTIS